MLLGVAAGRSYRARAVVSCYVFAKKEKTSVEGKEGEMERGGGEVGDRKKCKKKVHLKR